MAITKIWSWTQEEAPLKDGLNSYHSYSDSHMDSSFWRLMKTWVFVCVLYHDHKLATTKIKQYSLQTLCSNSARLNEPRQSDANGKCTECPFTQFTEYWLRVKLSVYVPFHYSTQVAAIQNCHANPRGKWKLEYRVLQNDQDSTHEQFWY